MAGRRSSTRQIARSLARFHELDWKDREQRTSVLWLSHQLIYRFQQREHQPLEGDDRIFLSHRWVRGLLDRIDERRGEKAARQAIPTAIALGLIEPALDERGEQMWKNNSAGNSTNPGWHFYRWRVFRVPALSAAAESSSQSTGTTPYLGGAYGTGFPLENPPAGPAAVPGGPLKALILLLARPAVKSDSRQTRSFSRGSVQWAFHHTGPP
jgi:hypothetical protein